MPITRCFLFVSLAVAIGVPGTGAAGPQPNLSTTPTLQAAGTPTVAPTPRPKKVNKTKGRKAFKKGKVKAKKPSKQPKKAKRAKIKKVKKGKTKKAKKGKASKGKKKKEPAPLLECPCWNQVTQKELVQIMEGNLTRFPSCGLSEGLDLRANIGGLDPDLPIFFLLEAQVDRNGRGRCDVSGATSADLFPLENARIFDVDGALCIDELLSLMPLVSWCPEPRR